MRVWVVGLLLCASLRAEPFECGKLAKASGTVIQGRAQIHTGSNSRVEIQFPDGRVVRIGSNAAFECVPGTLQMFLDRGTLLVSTPKGGKRATIQSGSVIVSGTDCQISTVENSKVIGLNGKTTVQLATNPKQDTALRPGEVVDVPKSATKMPRSTVTNLKTLTSTSLLMKMGPVPSQGAIENNATNQRPVAHTFKIGALSPDGADPTLGLVAGAMQTTAILTQETAAQQQQAQLLAQQQAAAEAAAAQQLANARAFAAQQAQQKAAAEQAAKVVAAQQNQGQGPQGNQGKGPQGNQGQKPPAPPGQGNQGNKPPAPPGQNK